MDFGMPAITPLKKMLDLAQKQSDDSAKKLGKLNTQYREAEKKLNMLLQYRQSYQARFENVSQDGMGQMEWRNFIAFINKLDAAIDEQRLSVKHAESNRDTGGAEYQACQRKLNSYDTLTQRYQKMEMLKQKKIEQKEMDEFASNRFIRQSSD